MAWAVGSGGDLRQGNPGHDSEASRSHPDHHTFLVTSERDFARDRGASLLDQGRLADALEGLQALSLEDPSDESTHLLYAEAIQLAHRDASRPGGEACRCGSGRPYRGCCLGRQRRALRHFGDRQTLYRLRDHLLDYFLDNPNFEPTRDLALEAWFGEGGSSFEDDPTELADDARVLAPFAYEWACTNLPVHWNGERDDCLLGCFAGNPSEPAALTKRAGAWLDHGLYGLWQCSAPEAAPGVWLTDLLTGIHRYVSIPPEQIEALAPWVVLGGQLLPVDGVWRTGGVLLVMSPKEADVVASSVRDLWPEVVEEAERLHGRRRPRDRKPVTRPLGSEAAAELTSPLVGMAMPGIKQSLEEARSCPPKLRNSEGEPLMFITARIKVRDARPLRLAMSDHPDFIEGADCGVIWLGCEMTRVEAETLRAAALAYAAERGEALVEEEGPQRYERGHLRFRGRTLVAEVNSEARLDNLLELLRRFGADPEPISTKRTDPQAMLERERIRHQESKAGRRSGAGDHPESRTDDLPTERELCPEAMLAWQRAWLDEPIPALGDLSPRRAAEEAESRVDLEALLRQLEYTSARRGALAGLDWAAIRAELGMSPASL